jgi:hypothetical protein
MNILPSLEIDYILIFMDVKNYLMLSQMLFNLSYNSMSFEKIFFFINFLLFPYMTCTMYKFNFTREI